MKKLIASLFIALGIMTVPQTVLANATTDAALYYGLGAGLSYVANVKAQQQQLDMMKYYNSMRGARGGYSYGYAPYNTGYGYNNNACMIYCSTGGMIPTSFIGYGNGYGGYGYSSPYQYGNPYYSNYGYNNPINQYYQPLFTTVTDTSYIYRFYSPNTIRQSATTYDDGFSGNYTDYFRSLYPGSVSGSVSSDYTKLPSAQYTDGLVGEATDYIRNSDQGLFGSVEDYSRPSTPMGNGIGDLYGDPTDYTRDGGLYGDAMDYNRNGGLMGGLEDYTR